MTSFQLTSGGTQPDQALERSQQLQTGSTDTWISRRPRLSASCWETKPAASAPSTVQHWRGRPSVTGSLLRVEGRSEHAAVFDHLVQCRISRGQLQHWIEERNKKVTKNTITRWMKIAIEAAYRDQE